MIRPTISTRSGRHIRNAATGLDRRRARTDVGRRTSWPAASSSTGDESLVAADRIIVLSALGGLDLDPDGVVEEEVLLGHVVPLRGGDELPLLFLLAQVQQEVLGGRLVL